MSKFFTFSLKFFDSIFLTDTVYDIENDGYRIKDEHKEKFTKFYTNSKRYEDIKDEFERIFNINLL